MAYMEKLLAAFNPVDAKGKKLTIFDFDFSRALQRPIRFGSHCFGCTAGAGSSCGGATA